MSEGSSHSHSRRPEVSQPTEEASALGMAAAQHV